MVKTYLIVFLTVTFLFIFSSVLLSQPKSRTNKDFNVKVDTVFFDLSNDHGLVEFEKFPQFPGGESAFVRYIIRKTKYPQTAIMDSITGKVIMKFAVNIDGSVDDIQVLRGIRSDIDNECIRVIKKMPIWKPGEVMKKAQKGYYWTKTRMYYSIPLIFTLDTLSAPKGTFVIKPKH